MEHRTIQRSIVAFALAVIVIIASALIFGIVTSTPPADATSATLWTLFVSLWLWLSAIGGGVWHLVRRRFFLKGTRIPRAAASFRQAALAMGVFTLCLTLNYFGLFQIWDAVPLAIAALLVEFFFQAEKRPIANLKDDRLTS